MPESLFADFDRHTHEDWLAAAHESLRGRDLESLVSHSCEGIDIPPLLGAEAVDEAGSIDSLPGQFPFRRGARAAGYRSQPWLIANELSISQPSAFNAALHEALAGGQTAITLDDALSLDSLSDLRAALDQIDLSRFPLLVSSDWRAPKIYELLRAYMTDDQLAKLTGCAGYDPLSHLARTGQLRKDAFERMAEYVTAVAKASPRLGSIAISTTVYHDAGAHAVQELALALASGVETLRALALRGIDLNLAAERLHFRLGIGENFFMEIAKFRAIKLLWAQVSRAIGIGDSGQRIRLQARGGRRDKTIRDVHVNLLRATAEALAAVIGGVDCLSLAPFDAPLGKSAAFSRRLSLNVQLILAEELRLPEVIDPAGGAWHIERLTDELAQRAWADFQAIEADGGLLAELRSGAILRRIQAIAQRRKQAIANGDAILVGLNQYRNADEPIPPQPEADAASMEAAGGEVMQAQPLPPLRLEEAAT